MYADTILYTFREEQFRGSGVFGEGVLARQDQLFRMPLGARIEPADVHARRHRPAAGGLTTADFTAIMSVGASHRKVVEIPMIVGNGRRVAMIASVVIGVLIAGGIVGFRVAAGILKGKIVEVLGPTSEIGDIRVGWFSVNVEELRIKGASGWPADDALRAERVTVVPSLRGLFSRPYRVRSITISKPYLSTLRTKEGKFQALPGLNLADASPKVAIGRITLDDGVVELFDATVARPPLIILLEQVRATVRGVAVPKLRGKSRFELAGVVKGVQRDGQITMEGWVEVGTGNSSMKTELRSVDLVILQPYLIKEGETGVQKGTFDLDLQSDVSNGRLKAPGKATIAGLELAPAEGAFDTFMGLSRQAMLAYLMRNGGKITVDFMLEGDINDPQFSINQAFTTRLAFAMANILGLNFPGMVQDVGALGQAGGEAAGQAAKSTGSWLRRLFGGKKKH